MFCNRCGAIMDPKQRYCMKCGAINYDHVDNASMSKYITKEEIDKSNQDYGVDMNQTMQVEIGEKTKSLEKASYIDSRIGFVPLLFFTIILAGLCYFWLHFSLLASSIICLVYFVATFYVLVNSCIFMKGGYSGFVPLVPFYGQYAFLDIAMGKGKYFLLLFIPVVGAFFFLYCNYRLAKAFGKSGWLTVFFPFLILPMIAFNDGVSYEGSGVKYPKFVSTGKRRNVTISSWFYCVIMAIVVFIPVKFYFSPSIQKSSFISQASDLLRNVKNNVEDGVYLCGDAGVGTKAGTYYVVFPDSDESSNFSFMQTKSSLNGEPVRGYITIVVADNFSLKYFITLTDGMNGFNQVSDKLLKKQDIERVAEAAVPKDAIICKKS